MTTWDSRPERTSVRSEFSDDADFNELLQIFAETLPEKGRTLRALHSSGNVEEVRVRAHQLKGAGGGFGFPGLTAASAELEQACRGQNADRIAQALDDLVEYLERIQV
jgi:histidine phosphotransfer protein HptB